MYNACVEQKKSKNNALYIINLRCTMRCTMKHVVISPPTPLLILNLNFFLISFFPRYTELEEEKTTQPVRIRSYNWCLSLPPRCSNYRTEMRDVTKLQVSRPLTFMVLKKATLKVCPAISV